MKNLISPLFINSHSRTPSGRVRGEPLASVGSFTRTSVLAWALAGLCAVGSVGTFAGEAVGDIDSGLKEGVPDNKKEGTSNFFVYSEQIKPLAVGPNAVMTHGVNDKDDNMVDQVKPVPIEQEKIKVANNEYGPPRGAVKNRNKLEPQKHSFEQLNSGSGGGLINDNVTASAAYRFDKNNPIIVAYARAKKQLADGTKIEGKAAAKATDPLLVLPDSYAYTPHLNITLERDQDNDFAAVEFFASDSAGPLWTLTITAFGPLSSDESVDFQLNAERAGGLIDGAGQSLNPTQIAESLRQALVMTSSGANLSDYELFPSDTQYVVDTETYYEFGTGAAFESFCEARLCYEEREPLVFE